MEQRQQISKMAVVKLFSDFVPNTVEAGDDRTYKGCKFVTLKSHDLPIVLQTSPLNTTMYGVRKNSYGKITFDLVLKPEDVEYEKLKAFDARIIELAKQSDLMLEAHGPNLRKLFTPSLKIVRGSSRFRVTFPMNDVGIWDKNDKTIDANDFQAKQMSRNAKIAVIVRCTEMWAVGRKFGTSWKAMQIRVYPNESALIRRWIGVKRQASPARSKEDDESSHDACTSMSE